jgi:hypothetical protein
VVYLGRRNTNGLDAAARQPGVPPLIPPGNLDKIMSVAVNLYGERG